MVAIDPRLTTVAIHITVDPRNVDELVRMARETMRIFKEQPGFVSAVLHRSDDGTSVLQYLQWRSREDGLAAMSSPEWQGEAGQRFLDLLESGRASVRPHFYEVVETVEAT
jgi:heme-degrading monooxygenase HmoA